MRVASPSPASGEAHPSSPGLRLSDFAGLGVVLAVTLAARVIPAIYLGSELSDLSIYHYMASIVLRDQDIYEVQDVFPYTPLSLFIPAFALSFSEWSHQPFHLVMKVFPLLGDLGSASVVFLLGRRRWPAARATLLGLAFALNPISILITGFHGNIMPLSVFFAFWAYYLLDHPNRDRTYLLSALALGLGIGLRSWPVLLLPFLLRPGQLKWRQSVLYLFVASLPSVLTLAPYMFVNFEGVRREAFGYKSVPDFGWVGAWRARYFLQTGSTNLPWAGEWLSRSRFYFLGAYSVLALLAWIGPAWSDTAGWIATALLLNFTLVGGMAAQYYSWVVPFLIGYLAYYGLFSVVAGGALVTFYRALHPGILVGRDAPPFVYTKQQIFAWLMGFLAATWAVGAAWVVGFAWQIVRRGFAGRRAAAQESPVPVAARPRWVMAASLVLASTVAGALAVEVPFIVRSRSPAELPASIEWVTGGRGPQPGYFDAPIGVAVHPSGDIYVADLGNHRVERFSSAGTFLDLWRTAEGATPALVEPSDVAFGPAGEVYVLDTVGNILQLEPNGGVIQRVNLVALHSYSPRGLAIDSTRGRFYVTDTGKSRILLVGMDGTLIGTWGGANTDLSFDLGWGLALDSQGNVFVAERGSSRVRKLSPDGALLTEWTVKSGLFDIAVGPDGRVYASASDQALIWVYDTHGHLLGQIHTPLAAKALPQAHALAPAPPQDLILTTEAPMARLRLGP